LRAEGYLTTVIENKIRELAQLRGIAFDGLEQSAHRIRANVAKLIQLAHLQMTE